MSADVGESLDDFFAKKDKKKKTKKTKSTFTPDDFNPVNEKPKKKTKSGASKAGGDVAGVAEDASTTSNIVETRKIEETELPAVS